MADVLPFPPTGQYRPVVVTDLSKLPPPPKGAQWIVIEDTITGEAMTCGWSHPRVNGEVLIDRSWAWAERLPDIVSMQDAASDGG